MKDWLSSKGIETDSLDKKAIVDLLKTVPSDVADVLKLRQQLAKSSVKKYQAKEVIRGDWGNGEERKQKLVAAGYDYSVIQKKVNEILK